MGVPENASLRLIYRKKQPADLVNFRKLFAILIMSMIPFVFSFNVYCVHSF